jgi:hypothetical protein
VKLVERPRMTFVVAQFSGTWDEATARARAHTLARVAADEHGLDVDADSFEYWRG